MSGRALAMARRKAMSGTGKGAVGTGQASRARSDAVPAAVPAATAPVATATASAPAAPRPAGSGPAVPPNSARAAALARRKALSSGGKVALTTKDRTKTAAEAAKQAPVSTAPASTAPASPAPVEASGGCGCGCDGSAAPQKAPRAAAVRGTVKVKPMMASGRAASVARRKALSSRGKGGANASGMTPSQAARSMNPDLTGRDLAKVLREQRSQRGAAGQKKSAPCGRVRPTARTGANPQGAAEDQPWKVGAGETTHGQPVTGTMVARNKTVTGTEASTCRPVTGTEYMDAEVFREFCDVEPTKGFLSGGKSATVAGNAVTGSRVSRGARVTGGETGAGKSVTGTEYVSAAQSETHGGARPKPGPAKFSTGETRKGKSVTGNLDLRSERVTGNESGAQRALTGTQYTQVGTGGAPAKVGTSTTLRGGAVTGSTLGARQKMTGDEAGSCRNVTGSDYLSQEHYAAFCDSTPTRSDRKVGQSRTMSGESVTGTMTGRAGRVTGAEPGTCKSVTGTPYAGAEQYGEFCDAPAAKSAAARMSRPQRKTGAMPMTGGQPSVGGKMTGERGICEPVSGTPYVGADQIGAVCPATPAEAASPDFPQPLGKAPWGAFSTTPPTHATRAPAAGGGVTGAVPSGGQITGPFGMATGKVTGTEEARFGRTAALAVSPGQAPEPVPPEPTPVEAAVQPDGRVKSRISGEGMDAGPKITGDDWERGDRVTGTEGASAQQRNPTRRGGPMSAMAPLRVNARNENFPEPVSKVTGSSGNTEKGAVVTYSGGARG